MPGPRFIPLDYEERPPEEMLARANAFRDLMLRRRTTRHFSTRPVARELIETAIMTAASAPSGANLQPWTFVVVTDQEIKQRIRAAAEAEERENYRGRMPEEWLTVLEPLGTDAIKAHITDAPYVVVLFKHVARLATDGTRAPTYYANESAGIAAGFFIAAIHNLGLVTLTHTPSPMGFLSEILERPNTEKPYLLMPVGYPADGATIPDIPRKPLPEVLYWR